MDWNKVNLRTKNKKLPPIKETVVWATNEESMDKNNFYKFFGHLTEDGKYIDAGFNQYKLTSHYWWARIDNPKVE